MKVDDCMEWVKNVSSHHSQWQNMKAEVWKLRLDRLNKLAKNSAYFWSTEMKSLRKVLKIRPRPITYKTGEGGGLIYRTTIR